MSSTKSIRWWISYCWEKGRTRSLSLFCSMSLHSLSSQLRHFCRVITGGISHYWMNYNVIKVRHKRPRLVARDGERNSSSSIFLKTNKKNSASFRKAWHYCTARFSYILMGIRWLKILENSFQASKGVRHNFISFRNWLVPFRLLHLLGLQGRFRFLRFLAEPTWVRL